MCFLCVVLTLPAQNSGIIMKVNEKDFRRYEVYALVTGAASGMGRLYALKLAARGYNLIIVDVNEGNLEAVGKEVEAEVAALEDFRAAFKGAFRVKKVVMNLATVDAAEKLAAAVRGDGDKASKGASKEGCEVKGASKEGCEKEGCEVKGASKEDCEVEVLVNNAGILYVQTICGTSRKTLSTISLLMAYTPLMICREFVPAMIERGRGYVLNISSLAAWMEGWPAIGMYSTVKRFVKGFSRELRVECRGTGVSVTNAYFGAVDTPLIPLKPSLRKLARNLRVMIDADVATDKALRATFRRRKGTMPGFLNKIFQPIVGILPDRLFSWALRKYGKYLLQDV